MTQIRARATLLVHMPVSSTPDVDRLRALMQAGDAEALDHMARAYGARLLAVARRCCRSAHDAEDAVQQALVQASRSMRGYRGEGSPLAWLSTLVARSCFRMNRAPHETRRRELSEDCAGDDDSPEVRAQHSELAGRLGDALMTLSRTDRLAFLLAAEGLTSDEIAAQFGMTSDAVRSRLKRARKHLRTLLADHMTHDERRAAPPGEVNDAALDR